MADPSETTQVSRVPADDANGELLDAVRALAAQVGSLRDDVVALRQETRGLPTADGERPGWDEGQPVVRESPAWVRSVDSPGARGLAVPWLLLEIVFLVAVAVLAAAAGLDAAVIAAVMVAAWLLVALGEWMAARSAVREHGLVYTATAPPGLPDDPSWLASPEDTAFDLEADDRVATRLPPPQPD